MGCWGVEGRRCAFCCMANCGECVFPFKERDDGEKNEGKEEEEEEEERDE